MSVSPDEFFGSGRFDVSLVEPPPSQVAVTQSTPESLQRVEEVAKGPSQNMSAEDFFGDAAPTIAQPETQEEKLNFAQRLGEDIFKRRAMLDEINDAILAGEQGYAEGAMQVIGKVGFGFVFDLLGEGLVSGARGLVAVTPDVLARPIAFGATSAGIAFLNTTVGKEGLDALKTGVEDYTEFKEKNPRSARNIESILNTTLALAPIPKFKTKADPTIVGRAGAALETKATEQAIKTKQQFVDDLIRPEQTKKVKIEQIGRTTEEGILKQEKIALTPTERVIAEEVTKVPGVSSKKTLKMNSNAISKEIANEAKLLSSQLKKNEIIFPKKEFFAVLDRTAIAFKESPVLIGDAGKSAQRVITKMKKLVVAGKATGSGLLKARKELDRWVRSIPSGEKALQSDIESAMGIAVKEIRNTTNSFLASKAATVPVAASLKKQSNLFRAIDNIGPKAAVEANNVITRAWQKVVRGLGLKSEFSQVLATAFGIGGLGAAAKFAPFITKGIVIGGLGYIGGRVVLSASAKRGVSRLLTQIDRAIVKTRDANLIRELRIDRAALLELLKEESNE